MKFYKHFKKVFYLLLERGERKEKAEEKHQCVVGSRMPSSGGPNLARNSGMCPDWKLNP